MKEKIYKKSITSLIILSVVAMIIFSSYGINRSIWLDEAFGPLFASGSIDSIIERLKTDSHPPLYCFLLSVWMKVFGQSEAALRSLSGLFYFLCVFSVYFIMRKIYDQKAGLICAFLFLLSPLIITHSQNARSYILLALFSILSTGYFFRTFIQQRNSVRNVAIYVLFNIFGTFTHYGFSFVLISQFISWVCHYYSWKLFKTYLIAGILSVLPFAIFWTPILRIQLGFNAVSWIAAPKAIHLIKVFFEFYHPFFYLFFLVLAIYHIWDKHYSGIRGRGLKKNDIKSKIQVYFKEDIVWFYLFGGSFLTLFLISFIKPLFLPRNAIISLFPLVIILFHLIRHISFSYKHIIIAYLLVAVSLVKFVRTVNSPWYEIPNRTTVQYLINNSGPRDIVIFTHLNRAALVYYLEYYNVKEKYSIISFPAEIAEHVGWINEKAMMKRESEIEDEARGLAIKLKNQLGENNKIWLFIHKRFKTPRIVKKEMDSMFTEVAIKKIKGAPFYDKIITYK